MKTPFVLNKIVHNNSFFGNCFIDIAKECDFHANYTQITNYSRYDVYMQINKLDRCVMRLPAGCTQIFAHGECQIHHLAFRGIPDNEDFAKIEIFVNA